MCAAPNSQETVYVVDDDFAIRDSLMALLEAYGFSPKAFGSGSELLETCQRTDKGCVLLDICLPEQDGFGVLAALRKKGINIPVVLISAHDERAKDASIEGLGAFAILPKPLNGDQLLNVVRRALNQDADPRGTEESQPPLGHGHLGRTAHVRPTSQL